MNRNNLLYFDWGLLLPVFAIIIVCLTTLFSINNSFFSGQLIYFIISMFTYFLFSHISYKNIQLSSLPIYIVSLVLLGIILILGIESRGAVRWIDIFGLRIQFSEILKPFFMITLAHFLATRPPTFKTLIVALCYIFPVVFLVLIQPDLGNAMIYLLVVGLTFLVYGFPLLWFGVGFLAFLGFLPMVWKFLHEYQKQRLLTFFYPTKDPLGTSYNVIQSIIAVGSGNFFGKGIGEATQSHLRFLPERHTDFIFATISEGLGFVGSVFVILCFIFLLIRIYVVVKDSSDSFCKLFATMSFFLILVQVFVNIGMNIGVIPIAGVTLPFLSFGGSSLLSNFIVLGILSSISRDIRRKEVLEIG